MAKVCHERKLIFVRVPRTGSTSFLTSLKNSGGRYSNIGEGHGTAHEARSLAPDLWKTYTTIGFIRDPWNWAASYKTLFCADQHWSEYLEMTMTPYDWLTDSDGLVIVDHIFRTEDMADVVKHFGLEPCHVNASKENDQVPVEYAEIMNQKFRRELLHYR